MPFSFGPQVVQNVEWSRKVQLLPSLQGFSKQSATDAPNVVTAVDIASVGTSMVVFVMRTASVDDKESDAPRSASLARNSVSRILTSLGPFASIAPPFALLTRNGVLDHIVSP